MAVEESDMAFRDHEETLGSALPFNRHTISFQSGAVNSTSVSHMNYPMMANYYGGVDNGPIAGTPFFSASSSSILSNNNNYSGGLTQAANFSSGSLVVDSMPALKHEDTSSAVEWSTDEQTKLEEGLFKYGNEPTIMRYVKIAATLRDKTVRDVALRCRWMTKTYLCNVCQRKRRKHEDHNFMKKIKDRKDKLVASSCKTNISSVLPSNMAAYSLIMDQHDHNQHMSFEELSATTRHLLEQNNLILGQISANLSTLKLPDNVDLLFRSRNNIAAILNDMREMPGVMSRMPSLPVSINEELVNSIFRGASQAATVFGSSRGFHLKQEPQC